MIMEIFVDLGDFYDSGGFGCFLKILVILAVLVVSRDFSDFSEFWWILEILAILVGVSDFCGFIKEYLIGLSTKWQLHLLYGPPP